MFKKLNILSPFFKEPSKEFNVREIARILKISPASASSKLKDLAREGILTQRDERMLRLYKANLDSDHYKDIRIFYSIRQIKESGLVEALNAYYLKPTIILFGSTAFGLDTENSDIDLVVVSEKKDVMDTKKYEKKLDRRVQLFPVKNIKELKNEHLINNVINGTVLQGRIKWI